MIKGHLLPKSGTYKNDISTFFYLYKVTNLDVGQIVALTFDSFILYSRNTFYLTVGGQKNAFFIPL